MRKSPIYFRIIPWVCFAIIVGFFTQCGVQAQTSAAQPPPILLGTAWYPEQWPESRWDTDLTLMQQAGVHVVRIGEFAWSSMEPREGQYQLDWMDRAITAAERHGIYTVLGTPTSGPPAWLTQKYPEVLRVNENGQQLQHGGREHYNFSDPKYRELARQIVGKMSERFGHNPYVLGWQIDNESAQLSYDDGTKAQFQQWLKAHYGTLENLNARWTTAYWSQTYSDWNQFSIPRNGEGNPGLWLSWMRFVSDTWRSFQKNQADVIRANSDPRQFITTNMNGSDVMDYYKLSEILDFVAWDDYVGQGHLNPVRNGALLDLHRGFKHKNFWITETQPGAGFWRPIANALDKGEVRAMAWHDIGHGADAVSYWQWRSAMNGQEQYHGTLVGADGTPVPVYSEVQQLGAEFAKAGAALADTSNRSEVAILHSYESRWAIKWQKDNKEYDPLNEILSFYGPLRTISQSIDVISPAAPLSQYKLVVAPGLNILSDDVAKHLRAYVRDGGNLVLGQRTGMKDEDNGLQPERQPGPLVDLLGGRVEQFYALLDPIPVEGRWGTGESRLWAELLSTHASDVQVIERYGKSNGWLDGQPAVITRKVGKGSITYFGAWLDDASMKAAAKWMLELSGVKPALGLVPDGVEVNARYGKQGTVYILINFSKKEQPISLQSPMTDLLEGGSKSSITLPVYGVAVLAAAPDYPK